MVRAVLLAVLCCALLPPPSPALTPRKGVWRRVEAVAGREAVLACEVGSFDASDRVYVILWYRNGHKEPFYSYDNRPGRLKAPEDRHTIKSPVLEGRATFRPGQVPALHIKPVLTTDQANYTCRVDFRIASSHRTHLSLWVVEPPEQPVVEVDGRRVRGEVLGPLQENTALVLTCRVTGGTPPPALVWTHDDKVIDDMVESRRGSVTVNQLSLPRLSRSLHNAHLSCVATNNNVTSPATTSITITMNLVPLVTRLEQPPRFLRVGHQYQILCISAGSRPHPNITWTLANHAILNPVLAQTEHGANMSTSRVKVIASRRHHGQRLSCSSLNPLFPDYPLTDSILLNVTYPPVVMVSLGGEASGVVEEGVDVHLICNVDANPPAHTLSWFHKDRPLHHDPPGGVEVGPDSVTLRGVTRHQAGPYVCSASNVEGEARGPPLNLTVNYKPVCEEEGGSGKVYAAGVGRVVNVTCSVLASPQVTKFSWVFNNSVTSERLPGNQVFLRPDGRSVAQFWARGSEDYGTLQCWAQNSVGRMSTPCIFHIIPAGRPEPPVSCWVVNQTYTSLAVACTPGSDGGLTQTFTTTVVEAVTGRGQVRVTSRQPSFTLRGLTPGLDYLIEVVAANALGSSPPVMLNAFTYKTAENRMRNEKAEEVTSVAGGEGVVAGSRVVVVMVVAAVVMLLVVMVVMVMVAKCAATRRYQGETHLTGTPPPKPRSIGSEEAPHAGTPHTEVEYEMEALVGDSPPLPPAPPPPEKT